MKKLLTIVSLSLSITTMAANVQCAKVGRNLYPVSQDAIKLADHLGVKTCNGKRFKAVLKAKNATMSTVAATTELRQRLDAEKAKRMQKEADSFSF